MTIPSAPDSPELALRRFLYLWTDTNAFISGDPARHRRLQRAKVSALDALLKDDPAKVIRIVSTVNGENLLPKREVLLYVLAAALTSAVTISDRYRAELYTTVLYVCKDDEEFFCFIKHLTMQKKSFPSGLIKVISRYYKNKEPMDLVRDVCKRKGYHGWTHKDLIKLSHIKTTSTQLQIAICFVLKGLLAAETLATEKKEGKEMIKYIKKNIAFKQAESAEDAAKYMTGQQVPFEQIPPQFNHNQHCLEALLKYIGTRNLLPLLLKLYKLKMLKAESEVLNRVVKILTDAGKVKASGLHPYEVFIALKTFEKGGKPKDPRLIEHLEKKEKAEKTAKNIVEFTPTNWARVDPTNCPLVTSALTRCLALSFGNVTPTNRRFLIAVEVSENMTKPCLTSKLLTGYDAAAIEVLTYLKTEKNVIVVVFNGPTVTEVKIDKAGTIEEAIKALKESEHGELKMGAPIEWARAAKKPIDVFVNIVHAPVHKDFVTKDDVVVSPLAAFVKYKSTMNMSSTKLILHNLTQPMQTCFPETSIDVRGFDANVPKVCEAYIKNLV